MNNMAALKLFMKKHDLTFRLAIGTTALITGGIMAAAETPKIVAILNEKKKEQGVEKLKAMDILKASWKRYLPALAMDVLGVVCIASAGNKAAKIQTGLTAAYALSEATLKEYKNTVKDICGEEKAEEVSKEVTKKVMEKVQEEQCDSKVPTLKECPLDGKVWCYDQYTGRYFRSTSDEIDDVKNALNDMLRGDDMVLLNEFYYRLNLDQVGLGEDKFWDPNDGLIGITYSSIVGPNKVPCLVYEFDRPLRNVYLD